MRMPRLNCRLKVNVRILADKMLIRTHFKKAERERERERENSVMEENRSNRNYAGQLSSQNGCVPHILCYISTNTLT